MYAYMGTLPQPINQGEVVKHFVTRPSGALLFTQSTVLLCKLQHHPEMEVRVGSNPNALSSKQPHTVTRPDVEHTLWLWIQHVERKGELINISGMQKVFEALSVPEDERLTGHGWVQLLSHEHWTGQIGFICPRVSSLLKWESL